MYSRLVSSLLYGTRAMLITAHSLWLFPWKQSVWEDPNQERTNQIFLKTTLPYDNVVYYMASSVSGQDEPNHKLWLTTQASKMELSYPLRTTRYILQEKFLESPIINPLLTKLVRSRWMDIGLVLFLQVFRRKRTWPISSHLYLASITHIYRYFNLIINKGFHPPIHLYKYR